MARRPVVPARLEDGTRLAAPTRGSRRPAAGPGGPEVRPAGHGPATRLPLVAAAPAQDGPRRDEEVDEPDRGTEPEDVLEEDDVDEASEESFPASDAPASWSGPPDG